MAKNPGNTPVIQEWVWSLSWKQQTTLLTALRGCDVANRNDASKTFIKRLRKAILHNAGPANAAFLKSDVSKQTALSYTKLMTEYPMHFVLHLIQAAEILGYNHPDESERDWWHDIYLKFVKMFGMNPETKQQNDERLQDNL